MTDTTGRLRRKARVRAQVSGRAERPRMSVFRSLGHIYVQVIDDTRGVTIAAASSMEAALKETTAGKDKKAVAREVGKLVAARCKSKGISSIVFDRGGFKYHGRVAAVADGAREGGLSF